ncbi:hypothetical protein AHAS_Ahas02G0002700 [Arachis hypogaea]
MLPIAYVVFETETYNSLIWFLRHLVEDLELEKIRKCTFMSDQQKCAKATHWRDWEKEMKSLRLVMMGNFDS